MKDKYYYLMALSLLLIIGFSYSIIVSADDDHHERYYDEKYHDLKNSNYHDHDDDDDDHYDKEDDYDDDDNYSPYQEFSTDLKGYWYKWSRVEMDSKEVVEIPIQAESDLFVKIDDAPANQINAYIEDNQVMVPIQQLSKYLGATVRVYPTSEIIEINKDNQQLIVRKNTRVVYENMRKVPMPVALTKFNESYYLPISVLANGLGFTVHESIVNNQIQLERIDNDE